MQEFERGWEAFEQGQAQLEGGQFAGQGPSGIGHFNGALWQAQAQVDPGGLPLFEFVPPQDGLPMFELEQEELPREKGENEAGHGQVQEDADTRGATTNVSETESTSSAAAKKKGDDLESVVTSWARDDDGSNAYAPENEMADGVDRMDQQKTESAVSKQIEGGAQGQEQMQVDTSDPGSAFKDGAVQQSDEQAQDKVWERSAPNTEIDACQLPHSALEAQNLEDEAGGEGEEEQQDGMSIDP
jgi:hypothetical protein